MEIDGPNSLAGLHLDRRHHPRGLDGDSSWIDWANRLPEGLLLNVGRHLDCQALSSARAVCSSWRHAFSLHVHKAQLDVGKQRAQQARAFLRAFLRAFPATNELVLDVSFRRTAREKIQASLDEHFKALHDLGLRALQLNLDLNSFNERKIKLPDVAALATWPELTRLTLQESGWRSQQLRVDASSVFGALQHLQELTVVCKYSGTVKARWLRPPSHAEQLVARMPKWPPGAGPGGAATGAAPPLTGWPGFSAGVQLAAGAPAAAAGGLGGDGDVVRDDSLMEDMTQGGAGQLAAGGLQAQPTPQQMMRPVVTQHLRCQMTQNQSMASELQKAMRRMTPALQAHVSALTFEIVEETYAEPARGSTPLDLSALPGLKSLTVLSGAEDALANSKLDVVGAPVLESLVLFDVSCGCWCYNKPGHGIPPRLLSSPAPCLRSLTVVGFVVHQCTNLHALSLLTCLEELRLEQPDPDSMAAVTGEVLLTWLPPSLRVLKLHSVVLPPCGLDTAATSSPASGAAGRAGPAVAADSSSDFGGGGRGSSGLLAGAAPVPFAPPGPRGTSSRSRSRAAAAAGLLPGSSPMPHPLAAAAAAAASGGSAGVGNGGPHSSLSAGAMAELLYGVAPTAPLPHLRELYLSKCKVPTLGVLGVCPQLTSLGVLNCLSCSGALPVAAALPGLRQLAIIHTLSTEQELGPSAMGGPVGSGLPGMASVFPGGAAGGGREPIGTAASAAMAPGAALLGKAGGLPAGLGGTGMSGNGAGPAGAAGHGSTAVHVPGLPLPPVVWGSDEQVAAIAACTGVTQLELILPRGSAGSAAVGSLAAMPRLRQLDVSLPCGLSEGMMGLAKLGRGGRLQRLTLWVDSRTCVNRNRSRQLQAIQRSLQAHMPDTLVEWAGAESRHSSWTGLEARVFSPH